jgi:cellulase/cellobiase CelA1
MTLIMEDEQQHVHGSIFTSDDGHMVAIERVNVRKIQLSRCSRGKCCTIRYPLKSGNGSEWNGHNGDNGSTVIASNIENEHDLESN